VKNALLGIVVAALGFVFGSFTGSPPEVRYQRVEVPVEVIVEREPDTVRTFIDRIRHVTVAPIQVAIAQEGALTLVQEFCKPVTIVQTDTIEIQPTLLLRSVSVNPGWWMGRDEILLTGPLSNGSLAAIDYRARGSWSSRVNADSLIFRQSRSGFLHGLLEFALPLAVGFGVAKVF
tara:strand:- start:6837 stop:7364 length:528 start_codon:yes stop_codon:yes gene_type:complete